MSMTQKILAEHTVKNPVFIGDSCGSVADNISGECGIPEVGSIITVSPDLIMVHEQLGGRISKEYRKLGIDYVKDPEKIVYLLDHWVPSPDLRAARMHAEANEFARKYGFIEENILGENAGICHSVLPERGFVRPGMLIIGADSHTTTYGAYNCFATGVGATDVCSVFATGQMWLRVPEVVRVEFKGGLPPGVFAKDVILDMLGSLGTDGAIYRSFEFGGPGLKNLEISARSTIANMVVEMGAKAGIFEFDSVTEKWLNENPYIDKRSYLPSPRKILPDKDADYFEVMEYDLSSVVPMVARPDSPDNTIPVDEAEAIHVDQVFIGSCTNGSYRDLEIAAQIIKKAGKISPNLRCIVIPATSHIFLEALNSGLIDIFIKAGCVVGPPTCGPCIGGHMGVLGDNEVCVSTSNRNFRGRMGSPTAKVYLVSPATAAATAVEGKLTSPVKYLR